MLAVVATQVVCVLDVFCKQLLNHVEDLNGEPSTAGARHRPSFLFLHESLRSRESERWDPGLAALTLANITQVIRLNEREDGRQDIRPLFHEIPERLAYHERREMPDNLQLQEHPDAFVCRFLRLGGSGSGNTAVGTCLSQSCNEELDVVLERVASTLHVFRHKLAQGFDIAYGRDDLQLV